MGFFQNTWGVLRRELGRIRRGPVYIVLMFVLPLVSMAFFAVIFSRGVPRDIPIAVLDQDRSQMSRKLVNMFDATQSAEVTFHVDDMAEGEELMRRGEVMAVVHIPDGFERDILAVRQTGVVTYLNGVNITANGMLTKDLQTTATTFSTGVSIQMLVKQGLTEEQAYAQAMPVYFDKHVLFNPYTNYGYYLLPSFLPMMLMIFTIMLTIFAIGTELKYGTAGEWFAAAGGRTASALAGKLIPYTGAMFLLSLVMNLYMYRAAGVPLNGSALIIVLASFMFILAYQSIAVLIVSVLSNLRLSLSIGGGYSVLAFTFSGLTFPLVAMDAPLRAFSYIFPFTIYTQIFVDQAMRGAPLAPSVLDLGILAVYIILPMLCLPRLKRIATTEKFWKRM